jgi:hypothetical protein
MFIPIRIFSFLQNPLHPQKFKQHLISLFHGFHFYLYFYSFIVIRSSRTFFSFFVIFLPLPAPDHPHTRANEQVSISAMERNGTEKVISWVSFLIIFLYLPLLPVCIIVIRWSRTLISFLALLLFLPVPFNPYTPRLRTGLYFGDGTKLASRTSKFFRTAAMSIPRSMSSCITLL